MKLLTQAVAFLLFLAVAQAVIASLCVGMIALALWGAFFRPKETALLFAYTAATALIVAQPLAFLGVIGLACIVSGLKGTNSREDSRTEKAARSTKQLPYGRKD